MFLSLEVREDDHRGLEDDWIAISLSLTDKGNVQSIFVHVREAHRAQDRKKVSIRRPFSSLETVCDLDVV